MYIPFYAPIIGVSVTGAHLLVAKKTFIYTYYVLMNRNRQVLNQIRTHLQETCRGSGLVSVEEPKPPNKPMTEPIPMTDDDKSLRALSRLEDSWLDMVRTYTHKFRGLFPYGPNTAEALAQYALYLLLALPVLTITLVVAGVSVGPEEFISSVTSSGAVLVSFGRLVATNAEVAGLLVAVLYLSGISKYHPIDKNDYLGNRTPTDYEEWEVLITAMAFGVLPMGYFVLMYFEEASVLMEITGLSSFVLSLVGFTLACVPLYYWMHHRYGRGRNVKPQMASLEGFTFFYAIPMSLYLAQVAFGVDFALFGSGVGAVFSVHLLWMVFIARRLRWAVYTDWAGYDLAPMVPLWGLVSRGPLVFAVYVVLFGEGLTMAVAVASFAPFVAGLGYVGWRAVVTGDLKKPPSGWMSSPGRGVYNKNRKANNEKMKEVAQVMNAIEAFNEFASKHDISTIDGVNLQSYNTKDIKSALKSIHDYEARSLTGDDYSEYMEKRQKILDKL